MKKIPIKIIQVTSPGGDTKKGAILDSQYYFQMEEGSREKIQAFEKLYFDTVKKATKIMPKKKSNRKAFHYWKIGKLLFDFNNSIKNEFEITNFNQAIIRDFGLYSKRQTAAIIQFGKEFTEKDISDDVSFSHYLELLWIAHLLKENGVLEKEKKRLLKISKEKILPNRDEYRKELSKISAVLKKKSQQKINVKK